MRTFKHEGGMPKVGQTIRLKEKYVRYSQRPEVQVVKALIPCPFRLCEGCESDNIIMKTQGGDKCWGRSKEMFWDIVEVA